jgi:hypothetical protein
VLGNGINGKTHNCKGAPKVLSDVVTVKKNHLIKIDNAQKKEVYNYHYHQR